MMDEDRGDVMDCIIKVNIFKVAAIHRIENGCRGHLGVPGIEVESATV
jgi:hypothetical protein